MCSGVLIHFPPFGRTTVEEQLFSAAVSDEEIWRLEPYLCADEGKKKWVYTLVVLRGSTVPHFIWAHTANAHIGGPEQLGRHRDGEW